MSTAASAPVSAPLPNVQYLNMTLLMLLHVTANRDPARAAYQFDLPKDVIDRLRTMSAEQIDRLVTNVDISLFVPREDLVRLLDTPPQLAGVLANVRASVALDSSGCRASLAA